ncbi:MAG: HAMP domain-containing histidine kinase, partial [Phycisphaerae bacterium]|nr:HAMP domain-containing histidine kinase [Phycisphaerae bacterium]
MSDATVTTSSATKAAPISADPAVMISRVLWLVHLRWAMVACFAAAGALLWFATGWREVAYWLWPLAALVAAYNLAVWLALHWLAARPSGGARALAIRRLTNAQIAADLIALTATMYLTGGAVNPLIAVMVFYLAVAASLLPVRDAYFQAVLAGLLYAGLTIGEPILEAAMGQPVTFRTWPMEIRVLRVLLVVAIMFFMVYFTNAILARLRRINRRLLAANRELAVLDLTKSRFLRISSHQLRSPIAAIHSLLAAIQEVGALSPKQFDLMQKIHNRSAEIMKQLDEMMLLSTVREKAIETQQRRPVDLGKVLAEVAGQFKAETDRREVALEMLAEGRLSVEAWEDALETV